MPRASPQRSDRRRFLKGALSALAGLSLAPLARESFAADALELTPVTDKLAVLSGAGGNVLVHAASAGQVLVDSGAAGFSDALLAALRELPGAGRVTTLFNTHWHLDQVGSNAVFGRAGVSIVAHEKTRLRLSTDYYLPDEDCYEPALPADAWPTKSFFTDGATTVGNERVEYGYLLEAHTDGDIYVFFRDSNVVAVGDAVSPARDPVLDWFGGGWIGGRVDALSLLLELSDEQTRFVPSYGPVVGRADVEAEHKLMTELFERMVELIRKGMSAEEILDAGVMDGLARTFDDPLEFVRDADKSLWAHHNTLSHDIV
jgi:cyclase